MKSFIKDNQTKSLGFTASNAGNAFTLSVVFLLIFSLVWTVVLTVFKIEGDFTAFANYIPAPLAVICALLTFYIRGKKDCFKLLKPRKVPSFTILSAALIMIGLLFGLSKLNDYFVTFIRQFMPSYEDATLPSYTPLNLIYAIVFICIIPTITEEILMRKIVLDGLKEVGEISAVFLGGFIFAIFHMSPMQTIYQFIVGCSFAYIVIKGGNYVVTMVAHFFNNLFIILNYYFFKITSYGEVLNVIIPIVAVACFVVGIIILNRKGKKLNGKIEREKLVEFLIGSLVGVLICMSMWISALVA